MKDKYYEYQKMFSAENKLWWYRILHFLIHKAITDSFNRNDISILDAGCGTGGLMKYLLNKGYENIRGFDVSKHAIQFTRKNDLQVTELNLLDFTEFRLNKKFDVIISNDTLCYFDDPDEQKQVLSNFHNNLNDGGVLIMNLPAFEQFEGIHDIAVGLKMRFTVDRFAQIVDSEMYEIRKMRFWPFLLSPLIYIIRKNQMKRIIRNEYEVVSDINVPLAPINNLLYLVTMFEVLVSNKYPFGSSLMVILRKKKNKNN